MVFGLFSKERALQRTIEKATNKLAQQPDRWGALEKLQGGRHARRRCSASASASASPSMKGVEDEQEKNWVVDVAGREGRAPRSAPLARAT